MPLAALLPPFARKAVCRTLVAGIPELRAIRDVIRTAARGDRDPFQAECDAVFLQRLETNPLALRTAYWENHFEWKAVAEWPELGGRLLDFGCGSGHSDLMLARAGRSVHGVDGSPIGIALARHAAAREAPEVAARVSFSCADVTREGPPGGPFDCVWSSHVFEHIRDPGPALRGLSRWAKPRAPLLVSVPLGHAYDDPGHVNHFAGDGELRAFLAPHLEVARTAVDERHRVIRALCRFP